MNANLVKPLLVPFVIATLGCFAAVVSAQTTQPSTSSRGATAEQMLDQMLKPSAGASRSLPAVPDAPVVDTGSKSAVSGTGSTMSLLREGTFVVDRTGRLTRSPDGQQMEFAFDSDGKNLKDPPVVILPNLKLMQMETATAGNSRDLRFRITGMVTEYRGRNYVLLEKVVVVPDSAQ